MGIKPTHYGYNPTHFMTPEDIAPYLSKLETRFKELETKLADPAIYANHQESAKVSREHQKLAKLFKSHQRWVKALEELDDNRTMLQEEEDEELHEMILPDIEMLEAEVKTLESSIRISLLPPDPNEDKNTIVEIRPAAGGDESALFAGDLFRLYSRYAEKKGWKLEVLDQTCSALGGIKSIAFSLSGDDVYSKMKYEKGVHRVQRIPSTESGGRIHTSTVTVAIMPEAEEVELKINPEDIKLDVFRASGPGGQSVNTTDSAVRLTHTPTGVVVISQQEKSQHRNKEIAMRILCARLLERQQQEEMEKMSADKKAQIGTGDRSERIRTYNFPQNRITDHRFGVTIHDLPKLLEGELDILLENIIAIDCERQLENLNKG
jgi:peptide chain release factor 1